MPALLPAFFFFRPLVLPFRFCFCSQRSQFLPRPLQTLDPGLWTLLLAHRLRIYLCRHCAGPDADSAARHTPLRAVFDRHVAPGALQLFANVEGRLRTDALKGPSGVTLDVLIDRIELNGSMFR